MSSTTSSSDSEQIDGEQVIKSFDRVKDALEESDSNSIDFKTVKDNYDTVISISPNEIRVNNDIKSDIDQSIYPSREQYSDDVEGGIDEINSYIEGETLLVAFGFSATPDYGEGVPSYREIRDEDLHAEGNWWDNLDQIDADILLDRDSFYGAADIHTRPEVFEVEDYEGSKQVYLLENQF